MIAVIKGYIVNSESISNPDKWLLPLREQFNQWGVSPQDWEIVLGDFFQIEIKKPEESLLKSLIIKSLIKSLDSKDVNRRLGNLDVKMSIGIGDKTLTSDYASQHKGSAFTYANKQFDDLKKNKLMVKTSNFEFDRDINLYLKLIALFIDNWSLSSAHLTFLALQVPNFNQTQIGAMLNIKQNSVSDRWRRAKLGEVLEVERLFRHKYKAMLT